MTITNEEREAIIGIKAAKSDIEAGTPGRLRRYCSNSPAYQNAYDGTILAEKTARNTDIERFRRALENICLINNYTDADAASDYARAVLDGADPDQNEDGSDPVCWRSIAT